MSLEKRITRLEEMFTSHLEQSGYIHADISWLKKAFWCLVTAGLSFNVMLAIYLLKLALKAG